MFDRLFRASEFSVAASTRHAVELADRLGFASIGLPLIGAGSGGMSPAKAEEIMKELASRQLGL